MQYFYDPMTEKPWEDKDGEPLEFIYSIAGRNWEKDLFKTDKKDVFKEAFDAENKFTQNHEYGVPIIEAIAFDKPLKIGAVNVVNNGYAPGLPDGMVVEIPAVVDGAVSYTHLPYATPHFHRTKEPRTHAHSPPDPHTLSVSDSSQTHTQS